MAVIGIALARAGRIATADDIFFLDFGDIQAAIDGRDCRTLVAQRREQ